jgi:hypothetical protein
MPDRLMARSSLCLLAIMAWVGSIDALELAAPVLERKDQTITSTCSTPHAQIRYTLDGSVPDARSGPYLAQIVMVAGFDLKVRAFSSDRTACSTIVTARGVRNLGKGHRPHHRQAAWRCQTPTGSRAATPRCVRTRNPSCRGRPCKNPRQIAWGFC